jgi:hypothetical protein
MAGLDLTTLARMKDYMGLTTSTPQTDAMLGMFIRSQSATIMACLERGSFISQKYTDIFDGQDSTFRFPRFWPVTSVSKVSVDNMVVPKMQIQDIASSTYLPPSAGWVTDPWNGIPPGRHQSVQLNSFGFRRGNLNCRIDYTAGYLQSEPHTPDNSGLTYTLQQPYGIWLADNGVTYADTGDPLSITTVSPPVLISTYCLDPTVLGGYQFSPADAGRPLIINYSYCPYGVEQATWEMVAVSYNRRMHPGQRSRSLAAQESVTYDSSAGSSGIPSYVMEALAPYRSVIPE